MKKKLKGMTLLEVIIAMVVMVIGASLLVESAVSIINTTKTSRTVVNQVNSQAPNVENKIIVDSVEMTSVPNSIGIECGGVTGALEVKKYHAPAVTTIVEGVDEGGNPVSSVKTIDPKSGDLKYFVLS